VWIIPALVFLSVTLPHLEQGAYRKDTGRYAAVALDAFERGACWTLELGPGRPYFNKPPLVFWIHGLVLDLFGPSVVAARLPSVLCGLAIVLLTVWVVRVMGSTRAALASGVVLALTYEFFRRTREISLDLWQLAFLMLAMLLLVLGVRRDRGGFVALSGVGVGLALLCKPFVALIFFPIALAWLAIMRRWRLAAWLGAGLGVALLIAAPWHISMGLLHGEAFWDQYLGRQVLGRARGAINAQGPWYYPILLGKTYWPWMIPCVLGMLICARNARSLIVMGVQKRLFLLMAIWLGVWTVMLMAFPDKRPRYTPPIYPALSVFAGAYLVGGLRPPWRNGAVRLIRMSWLPAMLVGLMVALLPIRVQRGPDPEWRELFAWLDEQGVREIHSYGINTNEQGWYRLETGVWPVSLADEMREPAAPPPGALVLVRGDAPDPPVGEVLFASSGGRLRVVRVEQEG